MKQRGQTWQPNQLCTSYFLSCLLKLKSAWTLWCQPCGIDSTLISILDRTTGWITYFPACPTGQNWQLCSSVHTILTRSPAAFPPETKWNKCRYYYVISCVIKSYSGGLGLNITKTINVKLFIKVSKCVHANLQYYWHKYVLCSLVCIWFTNTVARVLWWMIPFPLLWPKGRSATSGCTASTHGETWTKLGKELLSSTEDSIWRFTEKPSPALVSAWVESVNSKIQTQGEVYLNNSIFL